MALMATLLFCLLQKGPPVGNEEEASSEKVTMLGAINEVALLINCPGQTINISNARYLIKCPTLDQTRAQTIKSPDIFF